MALDAYTVSISLLRSLAPLLKRLAAVDPKLEDQARRASRSTSPRRASGPAKISALGDIADESVVDVLAVLDRVRAMTWRLSR
jgi:hypothetical protein